MVIRRKVGEYNIRAQGHTANIYHHGKEVDMFSFGNFARDRGTSRELDAALKRRKKEGYFPY